MRKVTVEVKVKLTVNADEGIEIGHIVNELEYNFADTTGQANIEDTEILDYEVTNSK